MSAPEQLEPQRATFVAQASHVTQLPDENLATLSGMEFRVLLDGEVNEAKGGRDLCLGIVGTALIGLIGLVATVDWDKAFHEARRAPFEWTAVLFAIVVASTCGAMIYQRRYRKTRNSSAYSMLLKRLGDHFANR